MRVEDFEMLSKDVQNKIRCKLAILAAMTPASRSDYLREVPETVLINYSARDIFRYVCDNTNFKPHSYQFNYPRSLP
jgi:hypothetical protein